MYTWYPNRYRCVPITFYDDYTFGEMIERASSGVTLYPGDMIGSGTVGTGCLLELGQDGRPWLQSGDEVELQITEFGLFNGQSSIFQI